MPTAAIHYKAPEVWMEVIDPKRIAKLMAIQDVSARRLALAAGWKSHTYMQRILRGEAKSLEVKPAVLIASFFGVGVDDLFLAKTSSEAEQVAKLQRRPAA